MPLNTVIRFAPGLKPVLKHGSHNQKDHAGKGGGSGSDAAWDSVLTDEAKVLAGKSETMALYPERYTPGRGSVINLKSGEIETRIVDLNPNKELAVGTPPRVQDYQPFADAGLTQNESWDVPGAVEMMDSRLVPVGPPRPPQHVYRVMSVGEFEQAKNRGYIKSDERMNLGSDEGTVTSLRSTGSFYQPVDGSDYRVVRIKYDDADGWLRDRDGYIKTSEAVPFEQVDSVSPVVAGSGNFKKHAQHDQKTHGRDGGSGKKLSTAEEGEAFFNSEEEALGFNRENDNRGALKQSVSNRIAERMSSTVTTEELIDLPLSEYERENFRRAMDPEYEGHVMVNAKGELTILASSDKSTFPTGSAEAEKMVRATIISHLVSRWALASNDNDSASLAVQDAAAEVFNIKDAKKLKFPSQFAERHAKESVTHGNVYREFVKAQYAETQEMFQRAGITEVTMYRGRMSNERAPLIPTATPVVMRPLSSWSSDSSTATAFSYAGGAVRQNSIVHKVTVPVKRIVSTPLTGNGCLEEQEFVIMGGRMDTYAMQPENAMRARVLENFPVEVSKAVKVVDLDVDDLSADWIKTLSWDLPVEPKSLEKLFGPNWRAKLEVLPAWLAAPVSLRVQNPVVIKFAPGLVPVLKHGNHNQKDHAGKGGASDTARNGMQLKNNTITYGTLEATIPDRESSSFEYQHKLEMAREQFKYWSGNFATRVASAQMMDIQGRFTARGVVGDEGYVHGALRNPSKTAGLDRRDRIQAETTVIQTAMLMDSSTERLPTGTVLYRGVRLDPKDP